MSCITFQITNKNKTITTMHGVFLQNPTSDQIQLLNNIEQSNGIPKSDIIFKFDVMDPEKNNFIAIM